MARYGPPKRKRRNSDSCSSISVTKYLLQIFNIIFLISGATVFGVAIWTIFWKHQYVSLLTTSWYIVGTYGLVLAGALAVIGGIFGCFGVFYEQRAIILCYTFLLVFVFLLECIVGGLSYLYETQVDEELHMTLNETFVTSYGIDEDRTKAIDHMQQNYICCGAIRYEDWLESAWYRYEMENSHRLVPDSCCITLTEECGRRDHPSNIPYTGCIYKMSDEIRHHLFILGALGAGVSLIHVVGMILSCCLFIKLRDSDE